MSLSHSTPRSSMLSTALARDRLGVPPIVFFTLAAAAPLTVTGGVVPTGLAVTGLTGLPIAFLTVAVVLAVFAVGYVAMARHVANAGAFYTFITHGLGRPAGVAAAWVALAAYNALQVGLYGAFGAITGPLIEGWFGLSTPWWLLAGAAWALTAVLGLRSVDVNGKVLAVLLIAEIAVIVAFSIADVLHAPHGLSVAPLSLGNLTASASGAGALLSMGILGFVGFEQSVVFSEEARDPRRTVPIATYVSLAVIAALYSFAAWAMIVGAGVDQVVDRARAEGPELLFTLAGAHLGAIPVHLGRLMFATSLIAAMISFHNVTARYGFALGREGVLPRGLGRTSQRTAAPTRASAIQSAIGLAVITGYAIFGWDPLVQLFFWGGTSGGLGVLLLITATALAVPAYFLRHPTGENLWRRLIGPGLALAALSVIAAVALSNIATLAGVEPGSTLTWAIPTIYLATAVLGLAWALILKARNPGVYQAIGRGARTTSLGTGVGTGLPNQGRFDTPTAVHR